MAVSDALVLVLVRESSCPEIWKGLTEVLSAHVAMSEIVYEGLDLASYLGAGVLCQCVLLVLGNDWDWYVIWTLCIRD